MNTKSLMTVCSVILIAAGIALSFLPQEIAASLGLEETNYISLQILGALYFGFGITNWMSKGNIIGGIYSRPITVGNFSHFFIGALALIKILSKSQTEIIFIIAAIFYSIFAILFGYVLFRHPILKRKVNKTF